MLQRTMAIACLGLLGALGCATSAVIEYHGPRMPLAEAKPLEAEVRVFSTADTRRWLGVRVTRPRPCPVDSDERVTAPPLACGREPASRMEVRIQAQNETKTVLMSGVTDSSGKVVQLLADLQIDTAERYRLFVARDSISDQDMGEVGVLRHVTEQFAAPAQQSASAQQRDTAEKHATRTAVALLPPLPRSRDDIKASNIRVLQRLTEYGALTPDAASELFGSVSALIARQVQTPQSMIAQRTFFELRESGEDPSAETLETVLFGGLTEYTLEMHFRAIDPLSCATVFQIRIPDCDALIAAANRRPRPPMASTASTESAPLGKQLLKAGMPIEHAVPVVSALYDTMMGVFDLGIVNDQHQVALLAPLAERCPNSATDAVSNVRVWQTTGPTLQLASCFVRVLEGRPELVRDALLRGIPLPVVREFIEAVRIASMLE